MDKKLVVKVVADDRFVQVSVASYQDNQKPETHQYYCERKDLERLIAGLFTTLEEIVE